MRIISQDGKVSVDFYQVMMMVDDKFVQARWVDGKIYVLGRYRSEECAREVFDDIHTAYNLDESDVFHLPPIERV